METLQNSTKIQDADTQNDNIKVFVVSKSSNTLKNNIDIKDDCQRKRTSLQIVPHNPAIEINSLSNSEHQNDMKISTVPMAEINDNEKLLNRKEIFNNVIDSNADIDVNVYDDDLKNKNSNRNSVASVDSTISTKSSSSTTITTNTTSSIEGRIISEDYHDLENGNFTDGGISFDKNNHRLSNGSMSSTDDYYLREKLQNIVNESLIQNNNDSMENCISIGGITNDALLSPHEGPMGRRYAEIVQFKNPKWSSETTSSTAAQQLLKSRRLPFCGIDSSVSNINGNSNGSGGTINISGNSNHENGIQDDDVDLDAIDSNDGCGGDDDLQALLPNCRQLSRDELSQSRASLVSSSDGGILAEGETSTETSENSTNDSPPCDLGLVERLLRTHPVWFLPGIQRAGAVHLLQGKEEGNFIVRGSSQPNTMAVSVRLPPDTGPYIEHYLIQSNEQILSLESSRFKFDSIPALIAHYAQCCDELPVQLVLPQALRDAKNRQQLSSLALLGQEFWRYPMANPKVNYENIDIKSPNSLTDTSGIGMTMFSTGANDKQINGKQHEQKLNQHIKMFSPTSPMGIGGIFNSQAGTPSDTNSSLSSFTTSTGQNHQLMSPESIDSVVLTMSPVDTPLSRAPIGGPISFSNKLSTFKSTQAQFMSRPGIEKPSNNEQQIIRNQRPTPPNTLNLGPLRMPPAPPVRWSKPLTPVSPVGPSPPTALATPLINNAGNTSIDHSTSNNFTVTTTVTFSVDNKNSQQFVEVTSPTTTNSIASTPTPTTFQTFSKRLSPEGECKQTVDTLSSQGSSKRWQQSQSSKDSNNSQKKILSPHYSDTPSSGGGGRQRRIKARKESKHYQESDILESPQVYCRSALGDKISDYEDLWTQDSVTNKPTERGACLLTSFRPDGAQGKRPDLLPEAPNITSLNCNLLSPANSTGSSNNSSHLLNPKINNEILETNILVGNSGKSMVDPVTPIESNENFLSTETQAEARNRLGLVLNNDSSIDTTKTEIVTPTNQTPIQSRSKQGSPFYAEPADALRQAGINANILRRSQRGNLLPVNHRHSEPPKCGVIKNSICPALIPSEIEKIAGSLDQLKNIPSKIARNRLDPWQVDSSWEFMGKNDDDDDANEYGDYDTEEHWNGIRNITTTNKFLQSTSQKATEDKENKRKPLTVHQIIAKRLPDLNLPELVRCSTPQSGLSKNNNRTDLGLENNLLNETHRGGYRISSYDNVERTTSYTTSFLNGIDSAHSDDGTVFSEPWDSSQWDSFLPHDGDTSESIHLSKCRPAICNSEDDTLMEDATIKDNQSTLKANRSEKRHGEKLATILRSRSVRDREVLCHPRNKPLILGGPGDTVRSYTLQLAKDQTSTFARNIENFISCTKESREAAPQVVMRNMRQFMNGMKNYLVKHGEADFHREVEKARSRLKSDEFLNLDSLLETVMHQLVVLPLREHLYGMFVDYYTRSSDIQLLAENVKYACARNPTEFGIRSTVNPPSSNALQQISTLLLRLQEAELPLDKLDLFLCIISAIFDSTGCSRGQQLGADDFLPILVYVVAKCGFVGAEIEAEFMWGLLQPALLNGEAGYYLTALCSAVHVLKCFMSSDNEGNGSLDWRSSSMPACSSVLRVIIPDECNGSLQTRTLPVRPHTTTREVCRIIAHKARITNPQDYGLFKLVDGEETILTDIECPQDARLAARGKHCMLAYKRIDAKIAWPTHTSS